MPLFLVTRPKGAEHLKNPAGVHAALVPHLNTPFAGFDTTQVAATAAGGFAPCVFQGDALGNTYIGPGARLDTPKRRPPPKRTAGGGLWSLEMDGSLR